MEKRHFLEIDLAKGFAIILAVIGHAAPDAVKGFWIAGSESLSAHLHYFIYTFHMPLFFTCSGFLLYPKLVVGGGNLWKRFKRLMIPYLFLSFVYLAAKMFGGGLADNPLTDNPIIGIAFGRSPCFGAWFLWVLFMMSLIVILLRKIDIAVLMLIFTVISFLPIEYADNFSGVEKLQANTMWLVLGCLIRKHYNALEKRVNWSVCIVASMIMIALYLVAINIDLGNRYLVRVIAITEAFMGISASLMLCYMMSKKNQRSAVVSVLKCCGNYCMDIYILSMFVLVPLRILYVNVGLMNYLPYYIWLVIASFLGCIIPILASKYFVRKTRVLKLVLLGG